MKSFNFPFKIDFLLSLLNKVDQVNSRGFNYSQALMLFLTSNERNAKHPLPTSCSKVLYTNYLFIPALPHTNNPHSAILGYLFAVSQACPNALFCPLPFPDSFLHLDTFLPITVYQNTIPSSRLWKKRLLYKAFPELLLCILSLSLNVCYGIYHLPHGLFVLPYIRIFEFLGSEIRMIGFQSLLCLLLAVWSCVYFLTFLCISSFTDKMDTITVSTT